MFTYFILLVFNFEIVRFFHPFFMVQYFKKFIFYKLILVQIKKKVIGLIGKEKWKIGERTFYY